MKEEEALARKNLNGSETILITEDEKSVLDLATSGLQSYGYRILNARNSEQALKMAEKHKGNIDLLLTDVIMPGSNGRELAKKMQKIFPAIKILFMSGYTDEGIARHGILDKDAQLIQKPFSIQSLAEKIRELLDQSK